MSRASKFGRLAVGLRCRHAICHSTRLLEPRFQTQFSRGEPLLCRHAVRHSTPKRRPERLAITTAHTLAALSRHVSTAVTLRILAHAGAAPKRCAMLSGAFSRSHLVACHCCRLAVRHSIRQRSLKRRSIVSCSYNRSLPALTLWHRNTLLLSTSKRRLKQRAITSRAFHRRRLAANFRCCRCPL